MAAPDTVRETFELDNINRLAVLRHLCHSHVTDDEVELLAQALRRAEANRRINERESQTNIPSEDNFSNEFFPLKYDRLSEAPPNRGARASPILDLGASFRNPLRNEAGDNSANTGEHAEETIGRRSRPNRSETMIGGAVEENSPRQREGHRSRHFSNLFHSMMTNVLKTLQLRPLQGLLIVFFLGLHLLDRGIHVIGGLRRRQTLRVAPMLPFTLMIPPCQWNHRLPGSLFANISIWSKRETQKDPRGRI
jgi:hypothetical protein